MLSENQIKFLNDNSLKIYLDINHQCDHCDIDIYNPEYSVYSGGSHISEIELEIQSMIDFLIDQEYVYTPEVISEDEEHYQDLDEYFNYQGGDIDNERVR